MWILNRRSIRKRIAVWISLFLIFLSHSTMADAAGEAVNQTVKAGIFYFEGYHMKEKDGNLTGYGIEFLNMISKYSHLNFEYSGYEKSWNDMLEMLENGEIDLVTSARKNPEREKKFAFSLPIGRNNTILSIRVDDTRFYSGDYNSYNGMKIGIIKGSSQNKSLEDFAREKNFSYQAKEYDNAYEMANALAADKIDAALSSSLRKTKNERTLDILETENFYAIVRKEDKKLLNEINYAIEQMDINEGDWSNTLFYKYYGPVYSSGFTFTKREETYIQDVIAGKKKITATASGDRSPYSYIENGALKGIMPDYFAELMKLVGMPYEIVVPKDREEYYELVEKNGVDVIIDRRSSDEAVKGESFRGFQTDTYLTAGVAKVTREDFSGDIQRVAIADAQGDTPIEKGLTGDAEVLRFSTREDALRAVLNGHADVAYVYTYTAQMFVNDDLTGSLHYSMVNGVRFEFKMYVRENCDHELVTILNKCIDQMPDDVFNQLITKYTSTAPRKLTFKQYMRLYPEWSVCAALAMVLIIGIMLAVFFRTRWNKKILQAAEQSNRELEKQLAIVDALSRDYLNVYAVNAKEGMARIIKMEGYVTSGLDKNSEEAFPYEPIMQQYVVERIHPEDRQNLKEALSLDKVRKKLDSSMEYTGSYRVLENGEIHHFQFTYVMLEENGSKEDNTVLAGFRNIDDVVREELEQKEALSEALAAAQHANLAKTTFLNNMSHDIRTPMNAIIGFTSLAETHIDNKEQVQNYLEKIMTSSRHLLSLINDVLDMSRIESGKVTIEENEANLPEIIHDIKTIIQSDIKAKQLDFNIDTVNVVNERIICDKLRLNQVLLNILSNAMKYTKSGGMVSVRIIQTADAKKGYASYQFKIKDTGIGMSREFLKHLFEPFEREQTATVSGIQGTGLGLAITKNIIDMMKGSVEVESTVGEGTEFTVSFQFRVANHSPEAEHVKKLENLRALIIDDNVDTCMSVSKMLTSVGMRPDWTTHGKEAVVRTGFALEQADPYDVYIIDWLIPDMNGIEIARRIRKIIKDTAMIVLLTAYDWADLEEEAKEAGITALCSKPIFQSELYRVLANPNAKLEKTEQEEDFTETFGGKKLLLAEDNEINQEIAEAILEEAGFLLDVVSDGTEAVKKIKEEPGGTYDLILMDIQMPIMDGYEATRKIRALNDPIRSSIPIVAMTANAFEEDRQKAVDAGMNGHVAKPIDVQKLMETLKDILG